MERLRVAGKESQTQWLTDFYMHNSRPALARGFKTKLWDVLDLPYFASFLINNNIRVIRLTRANTLRAAISTIRSHELHKRIGFWNSTDPTVRLAPTQLDFTQLDELIRNRERAHKQLSEFLATTDPRHILSISHEELTCNFQNTMRRTGRFLRTPIFHRIADRSRYQKMTRFIYERQWQTSTSLWTIMPTPSMHQ